jgi:hypothetical protein
MEPARQLRSARAKLQRAEEHLGQLEAEHTRFIDERNPYRMLPENDLDRPGYSLWRAKIVEYPPAEKWGSIAGECVHALRAALDHTAYKLVQINKPGSDYSEFPIFKDYGGPNGWAKKGKGKLPGVDRKVLAQAKWLQPYRRGGELDRLWIVHALDIIDKHRRLNLVNPAVLRMRVSLIGTDADKADLDFVPYHGAFEDGAVVARYKVIMPPNAQVGMNTEFAFDITFGEGKPPIAGQPVMRMLQGLLEYTGGVIARFERFFS